MESSETGGGSFESLYQHLRVIDRSLFRPVVVCLNDVSHVTRIRDLDIPVHVLTDPLFSRHSSTKRRWLLGKLRSAAFRMNRVAPWLFPQVLQFIHSPTIKAITSLASTEQAALIHLNVQPYRDFFALIAAHQTKIPCISHLRSADPGTKGQFNRFMAQYSNAVVAAYIANSQMTRDYWLEAGLAPGKMHVVLNAIENHKPAHTDVRKRWKLDPSVVLIGVVAPLRNSLKIDEFTIRVFAKFLENTPQSVLLIIGDGPMEKRLAEEANRLGISEKVILAGFQSDAKEILAGMDTSLILNNHDSFSRVAIESLQVGTPLIATDVGGIREIIQDRKNGLLVPYGDEAKAADALQELQTEKALRWHLVINGFQSIRDRFGIERYAEEIALLHTEFARDGVAI